MTIEDGKVIFKKKPTMVVIRKNLSKIHKQYFTMLFEEGCMLLKDYLEDRMKRGEKFTPMSGIIWKFRRTNEASELGIQRSRRQRGRQVSIPSNSKPYSRHSRSNADRGYRVPPIRFASDLRHRDGHSRGKGDDNPLLSAVLHGAHWRHRTKGTHSPKVLFQKNKSKTYGGPMKKSANSSKHLLSRRIKVKT